MSFNLRRSFILFMAIGTLAGCQWDHFKNLRWGEDNPPTLNARVNIEQYSCLKDIDEKVNNYLKGEMKSSEVERIGSCLQNALKIFKDKIHDPYLASGEYSPIRLAEFLNKEYLSKEKPITPGFVQELMKLKALLLGGTIKVITAKEIDGAIRILETFKEEALALLPHVKIYSLLNIADSSQISRQEVRSARQQINSSAKVIAKILATSGKTYSLESLGRLLEHLQLFLNWDVFHGTSYTYSQLYELIHALKEVTVGNGGDVILPNEWNSMLYTAAAGLGFYINYELKMKNQSLQFGPAFEVFLDTVNESLDLVAEWINTTPQKIIPFSVSDRLFQALEAQGLSPAGLSSAGLILAYHKLVTRGLRVVDSTRKPSPQGGLGLSQLNQLRAEFGIWADSQSRLNSGIEGALKIEFSDFEGVSADDHHRIELLDLSQLFSSNKVSLSGSNLSFGVGELTRVLESTRPFFKIDDNRAYIMPVDELPKWGVFNNIQNLSYMNLMKTLVRALIRSFASDERFLKMEGVTMEEMEDFHQTVKPIAVHLHLMDPRKLNGGKNYFNEANLFTFSGDGLNPQSASPKKEGVASYQEVLELLAVLWSSSNIRHKLYQDNLVRCRGLGFEDGPLDVFGLAKINRECFKKGFFENDLVDFENLPHLREAIRVLNPEDRPRYKALNKLQQKYVRELDPKNKNRLLESLQTIAEVQCEDQTFIENSELATMSTVLHYTETIFTEYDKDRDGVLNGYEAMTAFKRFYGYLDQTTEKFMGYKMSVSRLKAAYAFLVGGQKMPNWFEKIIIAMYEYRIFFMNEDPDEMPREFPATSMDREGFVQLLATLAVAGRGDPALVTCQGK